MYAIRSYYAVFSGFQLHGSEVDMSNVHAVPQWKYICMQAGLIWFVGIVVAMLAFMVSVLVRSTAASIVIMMAALRITSYNVCYTKLFRRL